MTERGEHARDETPLAVRARPALKALTITSIGATVSVGLAAGITALEQAAQPPTCYGLGWGCTPGPLAMAFLYGMFFVVPGMLGTVVLLAATSMLPTERSRRLGAWTVGSLACAFALALPGWAWMAGHLA